MLRFSTVALAVALAAPALAQTPIPPAPRDFLADAAHSDQYEITAAQDALAQSRDPGVRAFAEQMLRDHTRLGDALRAAAARSDLPPPPPGISADQAHLLGALQSLRGPDFDRAYAKQQVLAHTQAVAVQESFAAAGADANLRQAAATALPTIREHLAMARRLREATGGS